uniref:Calcium voltage-gated channel auxiliary subunit alpha2delta 4 n=1 Tax=Tetraodon nigroviridis TaxID=99883 RepID=H3C4S1_TETNG
VQQWASEFSVQLRDLTVKYSGSLLLQKKLKDVESIIKIVELNGDDLVRDYSNEIERMLGSKMKSVKRLAESAEDADLYHEFNASLEFDYYNSMLINTVDEDGNSLELGAEFPLEENEHFNNIPVNTQQSNIQVPTNVYNKDPIILNAIYNTEALNDVFISNFLKDPTLTWQYFGSSTGFFRIYPGIKWTPDPNGVVVFDCRNRNWCIKAIFCISDLKIIINRPHFKKMQFKTTIAKHTINTILDTLGENDFVNIIAYTDYVRYVEPCFKGTLVQADLDTREHFKLLVDELHVKGEAKIKNALKEAFKILNQVRVNGQGSMCNQAIMLITDGAMEDFESVFEEFNWPDRRVRVFTYLIGREMTFAQNTKWIACNNKGYYTHISTLADVQENVMEYLHVLSRPMVINHDHDIIWTEAYMDTVLPNTKQLFTTKAQSLLLMTSVAMPVFSKKKETLSHGILLGVVGSDIPLMEVIKLAPRYTLGPHGYAFLITNNGYILAHPDLRPLYKDGKKLKAKPNYNSVDLTEVEWEDTEDTLRTAMVKGQTGSLSLSVRASVDKAKRPLFLINEYFYTNIDDTPFSFGMVLTKGHGKLFFIGNVSVEEGLHDLTSPDLSIASEWTYCETDIDPSHRKYSQLQAAVRYLQGKEPDLECDEVLLQQLLFDAVVTAPLEAYWNTLMLSDRVEPGVETAFLGTRSGLMRVVRYAGVEARVAKNFLTPSDKDNLFTIHFPLWYRFGSLKYYPGSTSTTLSSRKAREVRGARNVQGQLMRCAGVRSAGVTLELYLCRPHLWLEKRLAQRWSSQVFITCDSNKPILTKCGTKFGWMLWENPSVEEQMKGGAFEHPCRTRESFRDTGSRGHGVTGSPEEPESSGAHSLLHPFVAVAALMRWFFSNTLTLLMDLNLCGLWHQLFVDGHKQKKMEAMIPCDTTYPGFMLEASVREANSVIKCGRCQKMFVVQQIPDSNLVLVVTQADCDCSRQFGPIPLTPKEIKY